MLLALDRGHNAPFDGGAVGIRPEEEMIIEVADVIEDVLGKEDWLKVIRCDPPNPRSLREGLMSRCVIANTAIADYFVSIHFNASNGEGHGTECYALSTKGYKLARSIVEEIAYMGFANRGAKNGGHLYVIRNTRMPAVLVEGCFCDNKKDMSRYNAKAMGSAIAKGILKGIN